MLKFLQNRPAETGGVAGALAILVAYFLGVNDATVVVSLAVVLGFVPTAITWLVVLIRGRGRTDGGPGP